MRLLAFTALVVSAALALAAAPGEQGPDPPANPSPAEPEMDPLTGALRAPAIPTTHRFGVAHISPRYNPFKPLGPTILTDGAQDALNLGFRTIKVAISAAVIWDDSVYHLRTPENERIRSLTGVARLPEYQRLFGLPFQTFFVIADPIGSVSMTQINGPAFTDAQRLALHAEVYEFARYLLDRYRGTRKVIVLQDHEMDWKTLPLVNGQPQKDATPSDQALANARTFIETVQDAVNRARVDAGVRDVFLYHMCEVTKVLPAMPPQNARTVVNDVIPALNPGCDLYGYSAYESYVLHDTPGPFRQAVAYLHSKARPSFAFGRNNVVISEFGVPERLVKDERGNPVGARRLGLAAAEVIGLDIPWAVYWTLYDNECRPTDDQGRPVKPPEQCLGYWVVRPDGSFGLAAPTVLRYLAGRAPEGLAEPNSDEAYVDWAYRVALGRSPDPAGGASALALVRGRESRRVALARSLLNSGEYRQATGGADGLFVVDSFRLLLGRPPRPGDMAAVGALDRAQTFQSIVDSEEFGRRFVGRLYRRHLGRDATDAEARRWLPRLRAGDDGLSAEADFLRQMSPPPVTPPPPGGPER
jgi:hypothetical protein